MVEEVMYVKYTCSGMLLGLSWKVDSKSGDQETLQSVLHTKIYYSVQ